MNFYNKLHFEIGWMLLSSTIDKTIKTPLYFNERLQIGEIILLLGDEGKL